MGLLLCWLTNKSSSFCSLFSFCSGRRFSIWLLDINSTLVILLGFSSGLDEQGIPAQQQALNVVRKFMQTLKFITFLFLVSTRIFGQTISDSETKNVFKSFVKDKRQVFLLPSIDSYYIKELNQYLSSNSFHRTITYTKTGKTISDTLYLTKIERLYVDSCIQSLASFQWTDFEKNKVGLENFSLIKMTNRKSFLTSTILFIP